MDGGEWHQRRIGEKVIVEQALQLCGGGHYLQSYRAQLRTLMRTYYD
jgi:hypothetical protein